MQVDINLKKIIKVLNYQVKCSLKIRQTLKRKNLSKDFSIRTLSNLVSLIFTLERLQLRGNSLKMLFSDRQIDRASHLL